MNLTSFSRYTPRGDGGRFVQAAIDARVTEGVTKWARAVLETAQALVPVRSGDLRNSGHIVVTQTRGSISAAVVFDSDHSVFVEFGTGRRGASSAGAGDVPYNPNWPGMPAQPYLRPAFDEHRNEAQGMVRETIAVAVPVK